MRCKKSRECGFTLIELLVAISILAIVAVLGWRGLDSIVRSRAALTAELDQTRGLQLTFAQMQSDCSQNVNPLSYPNIPEGRTSWIEAQRLILIRNEYTDDQPPAMQVVVYRIKDSNLTRFESMPTRDLNVLNQLLNQARNPPDNQVEIVMQRNVADLEFDGYPESTTGPGSQNQPTNPNPQGNNNQNPNPQGGGVTGNPPNPNPSGGGGATGGGPNPQNPNQQLPTNYDNVQNVNQDNVTTGLQVSLKLQNHDNKIVKIFMLGGA